MNPENPQTPTPWTELPHEDLPADPRSAQGRPTPSDGVLLVRRWLLVVVLALLSIALLVAFLALNQIVEVWLQRQWVPIARAVLALGVAGGCMWALLRLTGGWMRP